MNYINNTIKSHIINALRRFCNDGIKIKIVFSSYKIKSKFTVKDPIPKGLRSCVVYKFVCTSCGDCCQCDFRTPHNTNQRAP